MRVLALAALAAALIPVGVAAQSVPPVLQSKGCLGCHAVDKQVVGPAFKDVAAKYRGEKGAEGRLVEKLKTGQGHPMKIDATDAELKSAVQFVLAQGAGAAKPAAAEAKPAAQSAPPPTAPAASKPSAVSALAEAKGCFGCHAIDKQVVGPPFRQVAAKYRDDKGAEARLFGKLQQGTGHPIKVDGTDDEIKALVQFVLSQASATKPAAAAPLAPVEAAPNLDKQGALLCRHID